MRVVVLDSWAVLALLRGERPAVTAVGRLVNQAAGGTARLVMSIVNIGEVLYRLVQIEGQAAAKHRLARFRAGPVEVLPVREALVYDAALLKAAHPIAYADAFAAATARAESGALVTGDPELLGLPKSVVRTIRIVRGALP